MGPFIRPDVSTRWRMPSERPSRVGLAWLGVTLVSVIAAVSGHLAQLLLLGGLVSAGIRVGGAVDWAPALGPDEQAQRRPRSSVRPGQTSTATAVTPATTSCDGISSHSFSRWGGLSQIVRPTRVPMA